jgi:hypothetical protein
MSSIGLFSLTVPTTSKPPFDSSFRNSAAKFSLMVDIMTSENMIRPIMAIVMPVRNRDVSG